MLKEGQDPKGRFIRGHKLSKGRPWGARNKNPLLRLKAQNLNPRSSVASRFRSLMGGIIADGGGRDAMSTAEMLLAQRAAWISVQCELLEQRASPDQPFNATAYSMLTGRLAQVLALLGIKRQPRDVTPTLKSYLDAVKQTDATEADDALAG